MLTNVYTLLVICFELAILAIDYRCESYHCTIDNKVSDL
jgi:hypothetical protein